MIERFLEPDFDGHAGRTFDESVPSFPSRPTPAPDAPNVVMVVLDDVGFAQLGCYGSDISTPHTDALAHDGVRYTNFHVTPMCSPTRACLLTGRNHHSVGMGMISGFPSGFPNSRESVSHRAAMLPRVLGDIGYGTYAVGKWHLVPMSDMTPAGRFDHWPLSHGFDRFYGFLGGETDQYRPNLYSDNHLAVPPEDPGYHLSEDLVDRAITMISGHRSAAPDRPFFLYVAFGACHGPHQVSADYRERYRGRYDAGWDVTRSDWHRRQLELGVIPPGTGLAPRNADVPAWSELSADEQVAVAEYHEVYAAFLEHTDAQIGRLLAALDRLDCRDDTMVLVLSDNGASGEAGTTGTWNELIPFNAVPDTEAERITTDHPLGDPGTYPLYPTGWAQVGNTPLKWYKHYTYGGGIRSPLVVSWPGRFEGGGTSREFLHAVDVAPTIAQAAGAVFGDTVDGLPQIPVAGRSFLAVPGHDDGHTLPRVQYFEMHGHRGIYADGWKALTNHTPGTPFDADRWELYHLDTDFAELDDLAEAEPERLAALRDLWWLEAGRHGVAPLDDRFLERAQDRRGTDNEGRTTYVYYRGTDRISESSGAEIRSATFTVTAELDGFSDGDEGVLVAFGGRFAGFVLHVCDGHLWFEYNSYAEMTSLRSTAAIEPGTSTLGFAWRSDGAGTPADVTLHADGAAFGTVQVARPVPYYAGGNGFEIGANRISSVSDRYTRPFEYRGALRRVVIDTEPPGVDAAAARRSAARHD